MDSQEPVRDLLAEWLSLGREVLARYYPTTTSAVMVAEQGEGLPAVQLIVIPPSSAGPSAPRP